ncbi:hypothetical protein IEQ34_009267 [Dendrobium chrysotoxum]|uniref:RRM domain-containing protein n=1 Tax=Dendrobium chrysotoxum TaxID=161865 RepID=A0AAV7H049_DENCH|nr:hypothetical protein IEQ34_009267 [Dendrobium chrysotoxum]
MESEKGKVAAATNDTVDNEGAHHGRPWNLLLEQHLRSLLNTLDKNELVDLHVKLGMTIPQAAEEIRGAARPDPAHRKLFVYGFGEETTSETLCDAFSSYGEIEEGRVMVDDATGKSRRSGFIIFKNIESVPKALEREGTMLDGRLAFHHPALEGFDGAIATAYVESRRLHVADIPTDITTAMFLCFFEKYGEIEEGSVICDRRTGKSRGFGFVTFKTSQSAMNAITDPEKKLGRNRISERTCCITILFCFSSLGPRRKASLMESEKGKGAATNDSVDNEGARAQYGEPWNHFMEAHLRSLTQTLHKQELVDHLVKLGMTFPQAAEEIRYYARLYLADRRLAVYGLREETTSETLCDAFSSYGEIAEGHVMTDSATGKSRRFGFITFKNINSVKKALEKEGTLVDGRLAFHHPPTLAFNGAMANADVELRRLFVANISADVTTEMLLGFFAKYGEIEEGSLLFDEVTRKSKGCGFVTFKTFEATMSAINDPDKILASKKLFVKHADKYKQRIV